MEQRYQEVLAVIADGRVVGEVAAQFGVSRQSVHSWLRRYEDHGLEGLANRSHKPKSSPHQMPAHVEAAVLELRREHRSWGPRRLVYELLKRGVEPLQSETGVYRALKHVGEEPNQFWPSLLPVVTAAKLTQPEPIAGGCESR